MKNNKRVCLVIFSLLILSIGFVLPVTGAQSDKTSVQTEAVLVQEAKITPIAGKFDTLPVKEEIGDYFAAKNATPTTIMVQYGLQAPPQKGVVLTLSQEDREVRRITVNDRCGRVIFKGLSPETEYVARTICPTSMKSSSIFAARVSCRTTKPPKGGHLLKLAVVSDTHISAITRAGGRMHCKSVDILKGVCAEANRRECSVMIFAGDITDANHPHEYVLTKEGISEYQGKLIMTPGNHDDRTPEAATWRSHFGDDAGLQTINGVQFLWLNTANSRLNKPGNLAAIERLDPNVPAVIFSHMQLVPDDYLNDASKVIRDAGEVEAQLDKIGRSKAIIYIGHKNVATTTKLGNVLQMNVPQTTQFPAAWLEVEIHPEGLYHCYVPSCSTELEELSRLLKGGNMRGIGYRDIYSFDIWNSFVPWPNK